MEDMHTLGRASSPYWPQRLLHIHSMTSWERKAGNEYGQDAPVKEPPYATFSYTWGRFECSAGEALSIANLKWVVPPVTPGHFSAHEFQHIINEIAAVTGVKYLWLDVACISQEDRSIHAEEVGRQKDIFQNSSLGFVWLTTFHSDGLSSLFAKLEKLSLHMAERAMHLSSCRTEKSAVTTENEDFLKIASELITTLVKDPWFSSLWTLQEAFANPDSVFLSIDKVMIKDFRSPEKLSRVHDLEIIHGGTNNQHLHNYGNRLSDEPGHKEDTAMQQKYVTLRWLATVCQNINGFIQLVKPDSEPFLQRSTMLKQLERKLKAVGLSSFSSANYNKVFDLARFRYEARPGDRIHGIMHVYGFSVDDLTEHPIPRIHNPQAIEDLEYGFSCALLQNYSVLSQLFVHDVAPEMGQSWRMNNTCIVPDFDIFFDCSGSFRLLCSFTALDTCSAGFTGTACDFRILAEWWLGQMSKYDCAQSEHLDHGTLVGVAMDESYVVGKDRTRVRSRILVELPERLPGGPCGQKRWLISRHLSGTLLQYLDLLSHAEVRIFLLGITTTSPSFNIGLVLLHVTRSDYDVGAEGWQRLGLVFWTAESETRSVQVATTEAPDGFVASYIKWSPLSGVLL